MIIQVDSREKDNKYILDYFKSVNQQYVTGQKLICGDYSDVLNHSICIDKKSSGSGLLEITQNICQDHKRFITEIERANECGIKLIFLIQEENITSISDVLHWQNPRYLQWVKVRNCQNVGKMMKYKISKQPPMTGEILFKAMVAIKGKYGCEYVFANKVDMGSIIIKLLAEKEGVYGQ